jgi:hypothetical protein
MNHEISYMNFVYDSSIDIDKVLLNRKIVQFYITSKEQNLEYKYFKLNIDIQTEYLGTTISGVQIPIVLNRQFQHVCRCGNCNGMERYFRSRDGYDFIMNIVSKLNIYGKYANYDEVSVWFHDIRDDENRYPNFSEYQTEPTIYDIKIKDLNFEDIDRILYPDEYKHRLDD